MSRSQNWTRPPGRPKVVSESDWVKAVNKFDSPCLTVVKLVSECQYTYIVGYVRVESWEVCECKWSFVSRSQNWSRPPSRPKVITAADRVKVVNKFVSSCLIAAKRVANC